MQRTLTRIGVASARVRVGTAERQVLEQLRPRCGHCGLPFTPAQPGWRFCRPSCRAAGPSAEPQSIALFGQAER